MKDLIVFRVCNNRYALNIENIQRIIQATELTKIPNAHHLIDGMLSYESEVIKVLNFRKLIGNDSYSKELEGLFSHFKLSHLEWIKGLRAYVENGTPFSGSINVEKCELGKWLSTFSSYDNDVTLMFKELSEQHKNIHTKSAEILELDETQNDLAKEILESEINRSFEKTMNGLNKFIEVSDKVANSLQKFIIYENDGEIFAIKVDVIEDIAHIEDKDIIGANEKNSKNEFLTLNGILDLKGVLINIIETVRLPN